MRGFSFILLSFLILPLGQRSSEDPLQHLPSNVEVLTHFGERADISPDNSRVAFMSPSFESSATRRMLMALQVLRGFLRVKRIL